MRPLSRLAAFSVLLLIACYPPGDGKPPPLQELYFPTGVAVDAPPVPPGEQPIKPKYLYVVNSDFDLQYRAGSMISYDLESLRKLVPRNCKTSADCLDGTICDAPGVEGIPTDNLGRVPSYFCVDPVTTAPCGAFGDRDEADLVLNPGRCESIDPITPQDGSPSLLVDSVGIGAFATDVLWRANPNPDAMYPWRLFVPVRGDSTLHWIDVDTNGKFQCGQTGGEDDACNAQHRSGNSTSDNIDQLQQPPEPYGLDATGDGKFVAITNQTSGSVSLFYNDWSDAGPKLVSILTGLPLAPVALAALPPAQFADPTTKEAPGFLVAYRTASQIDLLRVRDEEADTGTALANYNRYALRRASSVPILANALGFDSRGIAIDDAQRQQDYMACSVPPDGCSAASDPGKCQDCLLAVQQPSVYVASRAPASLLVGAMTTDSSYASGTSELPSFTDSIALTFGASRVMMGQVKVPGTKFQDEDGKKEQYDLESRVFVVCFDSRRIFVYDPKRRVMEAIVSTGRGPYALAMDPVRGLAYLGHFTDSYLGVISLDQRFPQSYATIVASIGAPKAPRTSK